MLVEFKRTSNIIDEFDSLVASKYISLSIHITPDLFILRCGNKTVHNTHSTLVLSLS